MPGYFPYDLDKDEVERMTVYLSEYLLALKLLDNSHIEAPFDDFCVFKLDLKDGGKRFEYGIPKEIHVPDMIAEGALKALCDSLNIKLRVRRQLDAIESFFENAPF